MDISHFFQAPIVEDIIRLFAAVMCGALLGVEREFRGKVAGVRTNILIAVGSCIVMILSIEVSKGQPAGVADPGRIAAQVVSGIGFLGAGAIIQSKRVVIGLTTAATMWAASGIGLTIGAGYYAIGFSSTFVILIVLIALSPLESWIQTIGYKHFTMNVTLNNDDDSIEKLETIIQRYKIKFNFKEAKRDDSRTMVQFSGYISEKAERSMINKVANLDEVLSFELTEE